MSIFQNNDSVICNVNSGELLNVDTCESEKQTVPISSEAKASASKGKKRKHESTEEEETALFNQCKAIITNITPSDEYTVFGNFVANEIRDIKNAAVRTKLKRQIQKCLLDAADEDSSLDTDSNKTTFLLFSESFDTNTTDPLSPSECNLNSEE